MATASQVAAQRLTADYDADADVLYVSLGAPRQSEGEDRDRGIVLRYAMDNNVPTGVTVVGYHGNSWQNELGKLGRLIATHLSVPEADAIDAVRIATKAN